MTHQIIMNDQLTSIHVRRELWYRASVAWQEMLGQYRGSTILLVAHNAVNQVPICAIIPFCARGMMNGS